MVNSADINLWLISVKKSKMHDFSVEDGLKKVLDKMSKKDRYTYERVISKIDEVINCLDINHYKNLRNPLQDFKRVHIGPFVLLFKCIDDKIVFYHLDHHDNIYLVET